MDSSILIMPIERILKPLVIRRSNEQERQRQRGEQQSGYSNSGRNESEKEQRQSAKKIGGLLLDQHRIDYRV